MRAGRSTTVRGLPIARDARVEAEEDEVPADEEPERCPSRPRICSYSEPDQGQRRGRPTRPATRCRRACGCRARRGRSVDRPVTPGVGSSVGAPAASGDGGHRRHQISVAAPLRLRLTKTAATVLTASVMRNSTKPAVSSADSCDDVASPKRSAISAEVVSVPTSRMRNLMSNAGEMISRTATVSPSARPERQHRAADDAAAAEGQHDRADHAPPGRAERVAPPPARRSAPARRRRA